jgi:pimeloyl-ACP methyl ester carboxylesterase
VPGGFEAAVRDAGAPFGGEIPAVQQWTRGLDDLGRLAVPVLSVLGSASAWPGFRETHEAILERVPGARGVEVPATHLLQIAEPAAVADALAAFLAR